MFTQVRSPVSGCTAQHQLPADGRAADLCWCANDGVFLRSALRSFTEGLCATAIFCVEFTLTLADVVCGTSEDYSQAIGLHDIEAELERGRTAIDN